MGRDPGRGGGDLRDRTGPLTVSVAAYARDIPGQTLELGQPPARSIYWSSPANLTGSGSASPTAR